MNFEIKKGREPVDARGNKYAELHQALADAAEGEWLHVEMDAENVERIRTSITGSSAALMKKLRGQGYRPHTAVRTHWSDTSIPEGKAILFFRKTRD